MKCDLHIHSNCSDGIFSPEQIVEMAKEKGLDCIAVTDHDTVLGVRRAMEKGKELGVKVLVGVEISTVSSCGDVHILAYNLETPPILPKKCRKFPIFAHSATVKCKKSLTKTALT